MSGAKALGRAWETPSISQAEILRVLFYHLNVHNNIHYPRNIKAFKDKEDLIYYYFIIIDVFTVESV